MQTLKPLSTFILIISFILGACSKQEEETGKAKLQSHTYHHSIFAFGTVIDVSINGVDEASAEKAFEALEKDFEYMHVTWHPWQASAVSRVNMLLATGEKFSTAPSVLPLIKKSKVLSEKSLGLFDPAIGKLIRLWDFRKGDHPTGLPPDENEIQKLVKSAPGMKDITISGITLQSKNTDVLLDFGGFAKGHGIDKAIDLLKGMGITNAVINAGGDLRAIGQNGPRPWKIGIRHPRNKQPLAALLVSGDESVFTSGDYERFFEYDGKRYHHIIDPRTGYPATGSMSVTVIHPGEGATADAAATALFIAGPEDWYRVAKSMEISHVLLVASDGTVHMNPGMQKRITFLTKPKKIILSKPLQ